MTIGSRPIAATSLVGTAIVGVLTMSVSLSSIAHAQTLAPPSRTAAPGARTTEGTAQRPSPVPEVDAGSRNVAARARMLECGHQWSNMKRAGLASGTWKDFSRGCLAQK